LSFHPLLNNLKIKIYKTIILPVNLDVCETWSLSLREEDGLRVFENWVLRIFGPSRGKWQKAGKDFIRRSFITCILYQILLG
jgi:hypothetical protein